MKDRSEKKEYDKLYNSRPDIIERKKVLAKEYLSNPKNRERKAQTRKKYDLLPENRAKNRLRMNKKWLDPTFRKRVKEKRRTSEYKDYRDNYHLVKNYGITIEEKRAMVLLQKNTCAICGLPFKNGGDTHVDHNHKTGQIRQLLCLRCNFVLGYSKENIEILQGCINYLKGWNLLEK